MEMEKLHGKGAAFLCFQEVAVLHCPCIDSTVKSRKASACAVRQAEGVTEHIIDFFQHNSHERMRFCLLRKDNTNTFMSVLLEIVFGTHTAVVSTKNIAYMDSVVFWLIGIT